MLLCLLVLVLVSLRLLPLAILGALHSSTSSCRQKWSIEVYFGICYWVLWLHVPSHFSNYLVLHVWLKCEHANKLAVQILNSSSLQLHAVDVVDEAPAITITTTGWLQASLCWRQLQRMLAAGVNLHSTAILLHSEGSSRHPLLIFSQIDCELLLHLDFILRFGQPSDLHRHSLALVHLLTQWLLFSLDYVVFRLKPLYLYHWFQFMERLTSSTFDSWDPFQSSKL